MKKRAGGIYTIFVIIISLILISATAWLAVETMKSHNYRKGLALMEKGDYREAVLRFENAARYSLRPDTAVLMALADSRLAIGDIAGAKESFEKVLSAEPDNARARYNLGKIYLGEKDFDAVRNEISKLEELNTEEARGYAEELKTELRGGVVKGFFDDILKKIMPELPDALKEAVPGWEE